MNRDASILACDLRALSHEQLVVVAANLSVEMEKIAQLREHNHASASWCQYAIGVANDALLNTPVEAVQELSPDYVPMEDEGYDYDYDATESDHNLEISIERGNAW